ncbi:vegetative cell wall protein gp1 [Xylariaceae sp. FL0594]|nr:vegetative cell wall protein gp1 [Xylariaceae sp. FL0594]
MSHYGPFTGAHLRGADPYYNYENVNSPSPTPSPHHYPLFPVKSPQRSATRNHSRGASVSYTEYPMRPGTAFSALSSPRFRSTGEYATASASNPQQVSPQKRRFSKGSKHRREESRDAPLQSRQERRKSFSVHRPSFEDSDTDEVFETPNGYKYVLRPQWKTSRHDNKYDYYTDRREHRTDYSHAQGTPTFDKERGGHRRHEDPPPRSSTRAGHHSHSRHASAASIPTIPRSATARPQVVPPKRKTDAPLEATAADAKKHKIPEGYSLKNWDPTEEPIILLGSVFDANSLGKWIYDWTVHHRGPSTAFANMAGEMWLLLIQLSGKIKRTEEVAPTVRAKDKKEMLEDFIASGYRLTDKLRSLLKRCESPMLKASKKRGGQLGKDAGIEFVETLFGRDRELERTEKLMQSIRLWILRFDANCEDILKHPTR